jgi:transcriptional regulator with XRE-family HTH domain
MGKNATKRFIFTKEIGEVLSAFRKEAGLSQSEVAERIGLSPKSFPYVSYLETGRIKNPSLGTILFYLRACGVGWKEFFSKLETMDFQKRHKKIIAQLKIPEEKKKIEYDLARYEGRY